MNYILLPAAIGLALVACALVAFGVALAQWFKP